MAALAARIFHAPFATVTIVGDDRVRVIAAHGPPARSAIFRSPIARSPVVESPVVESPVVKSLCAAAVRHDGPHAVSDARLHPGTAGDPAVRGEPGIRFHAAAPIVTPDGEPLGSVNVMDTRPREAGEDELACLRDLAGLVMDELQVRLVTQRTVEIERQLRAGAERPARTLQRTLLPPALPRVPGLRAAAAYHPVSADEVGLTAYLAAAGPTSADAPLDTVHDLITALGEGVSDDTAVLALSVPPATRSSFSGSQGAA
ncbi:GAF domain-containing protein [Microbispora triticiradicis]|nr:GAF domain-containing protein [Microbispora triticiradicis]